MRKLIVIFGSCLLTLQLIFAGNDVKEIVFAERDSALTMDIYFPENVQPDTPCLIFVFGGGFLGGDKSMENNVAFCRTMSDYGFVTAAINYRLGLKGVK
ncbi:MAG: carboxylesterase family protein, partial [Tannerellaceae bacterium]|nr:carboxylesterase family protein [Tannerellaceae bacterium]